MRLIKFLAVIFFVIFLINSVSAITYKDCSVYGNCKSTSATTSITYSNSTFNQSLADLLYANIKWGYNQTQPFTDWLASFVYNYNQTLAASTNNPFDQYLNTTSLVNFSSLNVANSDSGKVAMFERSGQTADLAYLSAKLLSTKTSTMGDGFGTVLSFNIRDDAQVINQVGQIGAVRSGGADNTGDLVFYPINSTVILEAMRINYQGNIGIGTASPSRKLDIAGAWRAWKSGSAGVQIGSGADSDNSIQGLTSSGGYGNLHLNYLGYGNVTLVYGGGRVGVGTATPTNKLTVSDTATPVLVERVVAGTGANTNAMLLQRNNAPAVANDQVSFTFRLKDTGGNYINTGSLASAITDLTVAGSGAKGNLIFSTKTAGVEFESEKMRLTDTGNLGLGTTAPAGKLDVNGTLAFLSNRIYGTGNDLIINTIGDGTGATRFNSSIIVNENGLNRNTRIEGSADANLFVVDANSNNVNIGGGAGSGNSKLNVNASSTSVVSFTNTANSGATAGAGITAFSDDGNALGAGDRLGFYLLGGSTDNAHTTANSAGFQCFSSEAWSGTKQGSYCEFVTTPTGSTTASRASRIKFNETGVYLNESLEVKGDIKQTSGNATINNYYGGMYTSNNQGEAGRTLNATLQIINFTTAGALNGFAFVDNNKLELIDANAKGLYQITWRTEKDGTQNHVYNGYVFLNEVQQNNTFDRSVGQASNAVRMNSFGNVRLSNIGDNVTLRLADTSGTSTPTVYVKMLNVLRIGN